MELVIVRTKIFSRHSLENCNGCLKKRINISVPEQFPIKRLHLRKKADRAVLFKEKHLHDITQISF